MMPRFAGYPRPLGRTGLRNHVAVLSVDALTNPLAERIAACVAGAVAITQPYGRGQLAEDLAQTRRALAGLGANPNVGATLVVSQDTGFGRIMADAITAAGGPLVELLDVGELGSTIVATAAGIRAAVRLAVAASALERVPQSLGSVVVGLKCGLSNNTSGLVANRVLGLVVDRVVAAGGTAILSETSELIGAENILTRRAATPEVAEAIVTAIRRCEEQAARQGANVSEGVLGPENQVGGLSTLEEKALGGLLKSGSAPVQGVLRYAERPPGPGLWLMDSPMFAPEVMAGLVAAGATVVLFSTAAGNPLGFPLAPVIKVSANPEANPDNADHVDVDVGGVFHGQETIEQGADRLLDALLRHAAGRITMAEALKENTLAISRIAPSV